LPHGKFGLGSEDHPLGAGRLETVVMDKMKRPGKEGIFLVQAGRSGGIAEDLLRGFSPGCRRKTGRARPGA